MRENKRVVMVALALGVMMPSAVMAAPKALQPGNETSTDVATKQTVDASAGQDEDDKKRWAVSASYSLRVGQGTFVDPAPRENDPRGDGSNAFDRVQNSYGLNFSYGLDNFSLAASLFWTHWLSEGGGANELREFRFQDIGLSAGWNGHTFASTGIHLSSGLSLGIPTSDFSRATSAIIDVGGGVNLSKRFLNKIRISIGLSGGKTFHQYTSPVADLSRAGENNVLFRPGGSENLGNGLVAINGRNTEWSASLGGSIGFPIVEKLSMNVSYGVSQFWTYDTGDMDDEFRNPYADTGRGVGQLVRSGISLSYPFLTHFNASAGVSTGTAPKTADNRSFRFPFWNTQGAAANGSTAFMNISASY